MRERLPASRRGFLGFCGAVLFGWLPGARPLRAVPFPVRRSPFPGDHPTPRPGITAEKVLTPAQLADSPDAIPVFDLVREIPGVVDGIRCQCGCADLEGFYSLLSCFEDHGMARHCVICQGEGRLVHRLHKAGRSLDQIRKAIDARYG
ncbi:MAG: hypothetical protein ACRENB_15055 [Gemmatimonadales bacterium]